MGIDYMVEKYKPNYELDGIETKNYTESMEDNSTLAGDVGLSEKYGFLPDAESEESSESESDPCASDVRARGVAHPEQLQHISIDGLLSVAAGETTVYRDSSLRHERECSKELSAWIAEKRHVRKKKLVMKLAAERYLPLAHPAGNRQVDFGESLYYDDKGQEQKGHALTVSFSQSNRGYTQLFPSQNQECLLIRL